MTMPNGWCFTRPRFRPGEGEEEVWKIMSKYTQLVSDKLREDIEEYIDTHHLKEGDKLPSERFLAELF